MYDYQKESSTMLITKPIANNYEQSEFSLKWSES